MEAHGGNIYEYENKEKLLDFSSNINPFGVPESFRKNIDGAISDLVKYPDIHYVKLRKNLCEYTGVLEDYIFPGNGAVDIIYKGIKASGAEKVLIAAPTFGEYRRGAQIAGLEYEELPLQSIKNGKLEMAQALEALRKEGEKRILLILCNPNNPNGGLTSVQELGILAKELENKGGRLLIDEAFIEFTQEYPSSSFANQLKSHKNVLVVRAITKFFGMPGIRFGYGLTEDQNWLASIEKTGEPWAVNTFAELAVATATKDENYIQKTGNWIKEERAFMLEELGKLKVIEVFPTYSDFLLCKIDKIKTGITGSQLYEKMLEENILIRKSTGFTGLGDEYFRLAIKNREANQRLVEALRKVAKLI